MASQSHSAICGSVVKLRFAVFEFTEKYDARIQRVLKGHRRLNDNRTVLDSAGGQFEFESLLTDSRCPLNRE